MTLPHQDINEAHRRLTLSVLRSDTCDPALPLGHPVIGLRKIPWGVRYVFDDYRFMENAKRLISVGAAKECDICIDEPEVSAAHCLIHRNRHNHRVWIFDSSKNGIRVNGVDVVWAELTEGATLSIGPHFFMAYSERTAEERYVFAAATISEFVHQAVEVYGSITAAAKGIGLPRTSKSWKSR